jgi:hypothetical protein
MKRRFFRAEVKSFNDNDLTVTHFISTEQKDRSGDIMLADGMVLDGWPSVLKQHGMDSTTGSEPIAKCLDLKVGVNEKGHKGIVATTQYYDGSHLTPPDNTGRRLFEKAKNGFMPYWSIGFDFLDAKPITGGGRKASKWVLYEYSQVGVPDNVEAKNFDPTKDEHGEEVDFKVEKSKDTEEPTQMENHEPETSATKSILDPDKIDVLETPAEIIEHYGLQDVQGLQSVELDFGESKHTITYYGKSKETLVNKEDAERVKTHFDSFTNGMKSITDRVQRAVPYDALWMCLDAFMSELYSVSSTKEVSKLVKELGGLLNDYGTQFVEQLLAAKDKSAFIEECKAKHSSTEMKSTPKPADPASGDDGDNSKPPAETKSACVLRLRQSSPVKDAQKVSVNVAQLKSFVSSEVKTAFDSLRGKVA